jgi:hypothetical protein
MTKDEAMKIADEAGTKAASDRNYGWVAGSGEDLITAVSRAYNRSFLASLKASGFAVAPVEATEKMLRAAITLECSDEFMRQMMRNQADRWSAMLAAAEGEGQ